MKKFKGFNILQVKENVKADNTIKRIYTFRKMNADTYVMSYELKNNNKSKIAYFTINENDIITNINILTF